MYTTRNMSTFSQYAPNEIYQQEQINIENIISELRKEDPAVQKH